MKHKVIYKNHMDIPWHDYINHTDLAITESSLAEKASIIGRTGIMLLSCGTGAWRVRTSMDKLSVLLGVTCTADIGLLSIEYTCFDGEKSFTQVLCLTSTGVNTSKLNRLEKFVDDFRTNGFNKTGEELHAALDEIEQIHTLYSPLSLGLAAGFACGAFTFLLGGGPIEMLCAFFGASIGNYVRMKMSAKHLTLFLCITVSVSLACFIYAGLLQAAEYLFNVSVQHEAGYICSMLFIIPGFPFITSGIDFAKLDMRSGIERLTYAVLIVFVATLAAWVMAMLLHLQPIGFLPLELSTAELIILRFIAGFCGVFGFSVMFNSPARLAASAALIGAFANTLRLELIDLAQIEPAVAAFIGALVAGLLASGIKNRIGYPRIAITVPSIVIMVPGLYLYRAIYNLGNMTLDVSATYLASTVLIVMALPLGLIFARILTDPAFRHCT